jgi:hypothetical protein
MQGGQHAQGGCSAGRVSAEQPEDPNEIVVIGSQAAQSLGQARATQIGFGATGQIDVVVEVGRFSLRLFPRLF